MLTAFQHTFFFLRRIFSHLSLGKSEFLEVSNPKYVILLEAFALKKKSVLE